MGLRWGYSPKLEQFIPLGDFPADRYLIIARQAIANLGWKLSHISASGIIAYTGLSFQSYSEEVSIRIRLNFAVFKSECVGIQLLFNDYGKNEDNAKKFFHEFEYVEYHLKDVWEQELEEFCLIKTTADDSYFERGPLAAKDKIRNVFYLFFPQKGYIVTPIIINLNILMFIFTSVAIRIFLLQHQNERLFLVEGRAAAERVFAGLGATTRSLVTGGQWWRLISCQFFHFSLSHLFGNMYALVYVGLMVEPKLGSWKTLSVYLLSGIAAVVFCLVFRSTDVIGGASGAIFGMFGALLGLLSLKAYEKNANKALLISTVIVVALMLLNGLGNKRVAQSAHVGGAIAGFILIYAIYKPLWFGFRTTLLLRYTAAVAIISTLLTLSFIAVPKDQSREFAKLQQEYFRNSTVFNKVYSISVSMPKAQRLSIIAAGIKSWKDNKAIVLKMDELRTDSRLEMAAEYDKRVAAQGYTLANLMYKHALTGDNTLLPELKKRSTALNKLINELNKKLNESK